MNLGRAQAADNDDSIDIPPHKMAGWVRRWWAVLVTLATCGAVLYSNVRTVEAHETRIARLENTSLATAVNAALACEKSGAIGCIPAANFQTPLFELTAPSLSVKGDPK